MPPEPSKYFRFGHLYVFAKISAAQFVDADIGVIKHCIVRPAFLATMGLEWPEFGTPCPLPPGLRSQLALWISQLQSRLRSNESSWAASLCAKTVAPNQAKERASRHLLALKCSLNCLRGGEESGRC